MESIDATISRVLFHKTSKYDPAGIPFAILKLNNGLVAKGQMRDPVVGATYRLFGNLAPQKSGYPDAFEFVQHEALCDASVDGVVDYLNAHVRLIGRVKAKALVAAFGDETLTVLRTAPERALEVDGINEAIVESIKIHFADNRKFDPVAYSKLIDMFKDYRISKKTIELLLKAFGSDAPTKILKNPYLLLQYPRVGWKTADAFALGQPPKGAGYDPRGSERHESAVLEAMEQIASDGHTCGSQAEVLRTAEKLLGETLVDGTLASLVAKRDLIEGDNGESTIYQLASLAAAEATIAEKLRDLAAAGRPLPKIVTEEWVQANTLGPDQVQGARLIEDNAVCIVTGAPGVGKTYVISRIIKAMQAAGIVGIRCCAPTGKASKRLAELLTSAGVADVPSTTIHKALKPIPSVAAEGVPADDARFGRGREPFGFGRNEANPLDDHVVIVDECSMVDVRLMASLLRAIKPGTRVIFVGDHNQLPSVGPGSTLRDMIAAGIPTAELTEIRRSDGGGTIVKACHAIKDGVVPSDAERINLPTDNWIHIEIEDPHAIAAKIVELHATTKKFDPMWDMQVVSPQKAKLPIGCENLNRLLSRQINPDAHYVDEQNGNGEIENRDPQFKIGDKVVRTKNEAVDEMIPWEDRAKFGRSNPEVMEKSRPDLEWRGQRYVAISTAVVNGDMGMIEDIIEGSNASVIVRFRDPERLVRLPYGEAHLLMAYAMTVHKCVHPDTLVETTEGLIPIRSIMSSGLIATPSGAKTYRNFVENPATDAITITTEGGYKITTTTDHKIDVWTKDGLAMKEAGSLNKDDIVRLRLGTIIEPNSPCLLPPMPSGDVRAVIHAVPSVVTEDVAEFFGLMVADGTVFRTGFRLVKRHEDVRERFATLCRRLFQLEPKSIEILGTPGYEVCSTLLAAWLNSLGGLSPNQKDVPDCILRSPSQFHAAFLRGLFEDGWANLNEDGKCDHLGWHTAFPSLMTKVRIMLLRLGIISANVKDRPGRLCIYGAHAFRFATTIGFIASTKQVRAITSVNTEKRYRIPVTKSEAVPLRPCVGSGSFTSYVHYHMLNRGYISRQVAKQIVAEKLLPVHFLHDMEDRLSYHFVKVASIDQTTAPSMCVEVPDGHKFIQNGFVGGNCQGSGMPYVIVPVHGSYYYDQKTGQGLWMRELVYTAISRAEQLLITVGTWSSLVAAISRKTVERRHTTLGQRIAGIYRESEPPEPPSPPETTPEALTGPLAPPEPPKDEERPTEPVGPPDTLETAMAVTTSLPASSWPERSASLNAISHWTMEKREAWGRKANELEESGVRFPESERMAYEEMIT